MVLSHCWTIFWDISFLCCLLSRAALCSSSSFSLLVRLPLIRCHSSALTTATWKRKGRRREKRRRRSCWGELLKIGVMLQLTPPSSTEFAGTSSFTPGPVDSEYKLSIPVSAQPLSRAHLHVVIALRPSAARIAQRPPSHTRFRSTVAVYILRAKCFHSNQ